MRPEMTMCDARPGSLLGDLSPDRVFELAAVIVLAVAGFVSYSGGANQAGVALTEFVESEASEAPAELTSAQSETVPSAVTLGPSDQKGFSDSPPVYAGVGEISYARGRQAVARTSASVRFHSSIVQEQIRGTVRMPEGERRCGRGSSLDSSSGGARRWFALGVQAFSSKRYNRAIESLEAARAVDPKNALYVYFIALAQLRAGKPDVAKKSLTTAVALERTQPIGDWGMRMERVQGPERRWLEEARLAVADVP